MMAWINDDIRNAVLCEELNDDQVVQAVSLAAAGNMTFTNVVDVAGVIQNQTDFMSEFDLPHSSLIAVKQVHGVKIADVIGVTRKISANREIILDTADAMVTRTPGVTLSVCTADCLPVFIYDPVTPAIGLAHAGWRGTLADIVELTLNRMKFLYGTLPANCRVAIGPSVHPECFEVEIGVAKEFGAKFPDSVSINAKGASSVDLQLYNSLLLQRAGVRAENIFDSCMCTACQPEKFFSHRYNKTPNRMLNIISLKKPQ